ncbi:hypothetical protein IQ230_09540 [Gloeocapsopsis crepidinum LEGE 06123]|uniref:Globin domain-containing protein n=1 Tax=Gloeocapsopsis crepidinum LEGE 06123 TaxID=588587 RepID=A0ABR9UTB7_9CHRO|nr:globin family protein [Gloeocapsopsis crepidinum]MBE9190598.1 hypothetical protein [Gloeocapsopsis crepidinum LEGE 06123]
MSLQVEVLEQSFERVKPHANKFAASFYNNLLTDYPQLQHLFAKTDMEQQHQKLIMSLILVIGNLRNPEYLKITLKNLGERHVGYGTLQQHYPMVGAALLKTFESYLGTDWTPEVKQAWADAYGVLAEMMLEGAEATEKILISPNVPQLNTEMLASPQGSTSDASSQNYSQVKYRLQNEPQPYIQPVESSDPISVPPTTSGLDWKLIMLAIAIVSLLGLGIFYYSNSQQNSNRSQSSLLLK